MAEDEENVDVENKEAVEKVDEEEEDDGVVETGDDVETPEVVEEDFADIDE